MDFWLDTLDGLSYVSAYLRFPPDTGADVIMGIDQEFTEGVKSPRFVAGGDWMSFVGVQRTGAVWVGAGTDDTMKGKPSKDRNWKIFDIGQPLQPDTWYKLRTVADFHQRQYVSFTLTGPGIDKTFDLSGIYLDYPNYMPFAGAALTNYVVVMRGKSLQQGPSGAAAYFDDMEAGIISPLNQSVPTFEDSFEHGEDAVSRQKIVFEGKNISMDSWRRGIWYLERDSALCRLLDSPQARNGKRIAYCDATLQDVSYENWLKQTDFSALNSSPR